METGRQFEDHYDRLILATGSDPIRIPLDGYDSENVFTLKTIDDGLKTEKIYQRKRKG